MMIDSNKLEHVFDGLIKHLVDKGAPFDWLLIKAMMKQESQFNPIATSPVGARGLMQVMPATDKWLDGEVDGYDVYGNLKDGIDFITRLYTQWIQRGIVGDEADRFVVASYNAGPGNIIKAQHAADKAGLNSDVWKNLVTVLPSITGNHANETIDYVEKVLNNYRIYKGGN